MEEPYPDFSQWSAQALDFLRERLEVFPEKFRSENMKEMLRRIQAVQQKRKRRKGRTCHNAFL